MKKFSKRATCCIAYFLVAMLVMQLVFNGESVQAGHSTSAALRVTLVSSNYLAPDRSVPSPFGVGHGSYAALLSIRQSGRTNYDVAYCMGWALHASTSDYLDSTKEVKRLNSEKKELISYALAYGFGKQNVDTKYMSSTEVKQYYATQILVWIIVEGYFNDDANRTKVENYLLRCVSGSDTYYRDYYSKVKAQATKPSFITSSEQKLDWNSSEERYEKTFTNDSFAGSVSALNNCKVDVSSLPDGVTATINSSKQTLTVTSDKAIPNGAKIKITKSVNGSNKASLVCWDNADGTRQPMATLDYSEAPKDKTYTLNVYTENEGKLVIKKNSTDGVIEGVKFDVECKNWNGSGSYATDANGKIVLKNLPAGKYTVTEAQTGSWLKNYLDVKPQSATIKGNESATLTFNNIRKQINVKVNVTETFEGNSTNKGDSTLDGSKYGIYENGNKIDEIEIKDGTGTGEYSFYSVDSEYTIKQTVASKGHTVDKTEYKLDTTKVAESKEEKNTVVADFNSKVVSNDIKINKVLENNYGEEGTKFGTGIEFTATLKNDSTQTYTAKVDAEGNAVFKDLAYGVYTISENTATIPEGYLPIENFEVEVAKDKAELGGEYVYSKIDNMIKGNVEITKTLELSEIESAGKAAVKYGTGIKFEAARVVNGTVSDVKVYSTEADVNGKAVFENLTYGKWQISEVADTIPVGYEAIKPFEVNITENGSVQKFDLEDKLIKADVNIVKTLENTILDKEGTVKYAEGVKFVANPYVDGKLVDSVAITSEATGKDGKTTFKGLSYGKWMITEVAETVPEGYMIVEPQMVDVTKADAIELKLVDNAIKGKVAFTKTAADTGKALKGCGIKICDMNGTQVAFDYTGDEGTYVAELPYGSYTYEEAVAPTGYKLDNTKHDIKITENGQVVDCKIVDEKATVISDDDTPKGDVPAFEDTYTETEKEVVAPDGASPKTADNMLGGVWGKRIVGALLLSAAGMGITEVAVKRKKKNAF